MTENNRSLGKDQDIQRIVEHLLSPAGVDRLKTAIRERALALQTTPPTRNEPVEVMMMLNLAYLAWSGAGEAIATDLNRASTEEVAALASLLAGRKH